MPTIASRFIDVKAVQATVAEIHMAKLTKPEAKSQPQRQRFIDTAKEAEADETGETFEKAFGKIVPERLKTPPKSD